MPVILFATGVLLLAALWLGPLPQDARTSFTAHMTLHMGVVALAPPLFAIALAGSRVDPARAAPRLFRALPAAAVELAVVWSWHAPALHESARHHAASLVLEQGSFLAAGLLVWISAVCGELRPGERSASGVVALLLTSMHMTLLGGLLALAPRPLYDHEIAVASAATALADPAARRCHHAARRRRGLSLRRSLVVATRPVAERKRAGGDRVKRVLFWGLLMPVLLRRLLPGWLLESPLQVAARHPWIALAVVAAATALGGLAFAASGVMPLKASAGHWPLTEMLLQFSKRRSISTHALGVTVPPLERRSLVLRGAGHYDLGCRPCHGTPRGGRPRVALAMLPPPPALAERISRWSSAELFYIVKHGLKFTGMPAWPADGRDDEVWATVAFLKEFPQLDEAAYLALARGEPVTTLQLDPAAASAPQVVRESCARCHGLDGQGRESGHSRGLRVSGWSICRARYAPMRRGIGIAGSWRPWCRGCRRRSRPKPRASTPHDPRRKFPRPLPTAATAIVSAAARSRCMACRRAMFRHASSATALQPCRRTQPIRACRDSTPNIWRFSSRCCNRGDAAAPSTST
jgi:hypothetical protein